MESCHKGNIITDKKSPAPTCFKRSQSNRGKLASNLIKQAILGKTVYLISECPLALNKSFESKSILMSNANESLDRVEKG
jgi:hypothetical protein